MTLVLPASRGDYAVDLYLDTADLQVQVRTKMTGSKI